MGKLLLIIGALIIIGVIIWYLVPQVSILNGGNTTLVEVNSGKVDGAATLTPFKNGQDTIVDVNVQQLAANSTYALSIRAGSCYGALVVQLVSATTDNTGSGSSSTTVNAQISSEWFIVLHNGPSINDRVLACGRVVITQTVQGTPPLNPYNTPVNVGTGAATPVVPGQLPNTGGGPPKP